jgi:uncharacterized membrane protein
MQTTESETYEYSPDRDPSRLPTNVTEGERWITSAAGGALVLYGLRRKDWSGIALALLGGGLLYQGLSGQSPVYRKLGIEATRTTGGRQLIEVIKTTTVNRSPDEVYRFWRNFENLPRFMRHVKSVKVLDEKYSLWTATALAGATVMWEAKIINEKPNELIAWQSVEGSGVRHWGMVRFTAAPGGNGTEVRVELEYEPPVGTAGAAIAKLFGEEPAQQIEEDLRRFKQVMEAGEMATR